MNNYNIKLETFIKYCGFETFGLAISSGDILELRLSEFSQIASCDVWIHNNKKMKGINYRYENI